MTTISWAEPSAADLETARAAFAALHRISDQDNGRLWGVILDGPMLVINPQDRTVIANQPDTGGILVETDGVYIGEWPSELAIANTAVDWSGKRWCVVQLPLPSDVKERDNLIAHENFHRIQNDLEIRLATPDNNHLDKTDGRILLKLEMSALQAAGNAAGNAVRNHVADAVLFRAQRHALYSDADSTETALERTEGLAVFTGQALCGRTRAETIQNINASLAEFLKSETFVRSFAYETGALYGFLLSERSPGWQKNLRADEDLADAAQTAFGITLSDDLAANAKHAESSYDGERIRADEQQRADIRQRREAQLIRRFSGEPVILFPNLNMNIQFDGKSLYPLEGVGTYYVPIRAAADWGILQADSGAVVASDWSRLIASKPTDIQPEAAHGEGWTLTLNEGWYIAISSDSSIYVVRPRD